MVYLRDMAQCAPEHTIDGQQGQAAPVRMRDGVMPELRRLRELAAYGLASQTLPGLGSGIGFGKTEGNQFRVQIVAPEKSVGYVENRNGKPDHQEPV